MSDNDLIRRGEVQRAVNLSLCKAPLKTTLGLIDALNDTKDAIAALPAVTVGEDVAKAAIDRAIARLQALHNYAGRPAWDAIVAEEIRAALEPVAAPTPQQVVDTLKDAAAVAMTAREAALREAAAILHREIERVDAIAPDQKGNRNVSLFSVSSEYAEIEREILALIPKGADGG